MARKRKKAKGFFDEWEDSKSLLTAIAFLFTGSMLIFLNWLSTNFIELKPFADIFFGMLVICSMIAGFDYFFERNKLFGFVYGGKNKTTLVKGFLVGALIALFLGITQFNVLPIPFASSLPAESLVFGMPSMFIFVVIVAPYAEEKFFRMTIFPTVKLWFENFAKEFGVSISSNVSGIGSLILTSSAFALYHVSVFGGAENLLFTAFLFSVIAIVLNYAMKTVFAGYGLHLVNNWIAYSAVAATLGV